MSVDYRYTASMFIGITTQGPRTMVAFDPHNSVINNKPPCTLITGQPGSGKTYLALWLTALSALMGKVTVVFDPKVDFLPLANLRDEIGPLSVWDLNTEKAGLLDPFYMATDNTDKLTLVLEVLDQFTGGLTNDEFSAVSPIVKDVIMGRHPSLQKVMDQLKSSENNVGRNLGAKLDLISRLRFAKLCFTPGSREVKEAARIDRGLTIISLFGLTFPTADDMNPTREKRFASGLLYLLTDYVRRIMKDDQSQRSKTIVIDEAQALISTDAGARIISELALLGRSRFIALILVTQNNSHTEKLDIKNTISTRFAFQSTEDEARAIVRDMALPQNEGFEGVIMRLKPGECLMRTWNGTCATVQITLFRKDWDQEFHTNPLEKIQRKKQKASQA